MAAPAEARRSIHWDGTIRAVNVLTALVIIASVASAWFGVQAKVQSLEERTQILETQREREREDRATGLAAIATLTAKQEAMLDSQRRVERTIEQLVMTMRHTALPSQQPSRPN